MKLRAAAWAITGFLGSLARGQHYDERGAQLLVQIAIGWPVLSPEEASAAVGTTSEHLLAEGGYQSLCFLESYIVAGILESPEMGASRFCAAARSSEQRASMRCWSMATILVPRECATERPDEGAEDKCVVIMSALIHQRVESIRLRGWLATVPAAAELNGGSVAAAADNGQVNFTNTDHDPQDVRQAAAAFCSAHHASATSCGEALEAKLWAAVNEATAHSTWFKDSPLPPYQTLHGVPFPSPALDEASPLAQQQPAPAERIFMFPGPEPATGPYQRSYAILLEGFMAHPRAQVVSSLEEADWAAFIPFSPTADPLLMDFPRSQLLIFDLLDQKRYVAGTREEPCALYFKRSWVERRNGTSFFSATRHPPWFRPFSFSSLDRYYSRRGMLAHAERPLALACVLRAHTFLHFDESRSRVLTWVVRALADWGLLRQAVVGQVSDAGLAFDDAYYLETLRHARIVVTANPSDWEGDHRTWEALASGALVLADRTLTPLDHPLLDGVHLVLFDPHDEAAFRTSLWRYLVEDPAEAEAVAARGAAFVARHHRAVHRADYIMDEVAALRQASAKHGDPLQF